MRLNGIVVQYAANVAGRIIDVYTERVKEMENMKWTREYDESGGYDCVTSAITIRQSGEAIATIDRADYDSVKSWDEDRMPNDKMIEDAEFIVRACNSYEKMRELLNRAADTLREMEAETDNDLDSSLAMEIWDFIQNT